MKKFYKFTDLSHAEYIESHRNESFNLVFKKGDFVRKRSLFGGVRVCKRKTYNEDMYGFTNIEKNDGIFYTKDEVKRFFNGAECMFDQEGYMITPYRIIVYFLCGERVSQSFYSKEKADQFWESLNSNSASLRHSLSTW